jgi:hypothetical protein
MQKLSEAGKKRWAAMRKSNENVFYAFLRNRLAAEASDFPLFMQCLDFQSHPLRHVFSPTKLLVLRPEP